MSVQTVAATIQLILAPVVMVTSCAILVGGLLQRYAAINDRMRAMTRERFDLVRSISGVGSAATPAPLDPFVAERIGEIDAQIPDLLRRHKLIHNSVLTVYCAVLVFVASMFVIAVAAAFSSSAAATAVLVLFLLGTAVFLFGILLTALEVRTSQRAVVYEVERVMSLHLPEEGRR